MTNPSDPLANYEQLVHEHQARMQPCVEQMSQQLTALEHDLIVAQQQELARLHTALANDARFLLDGPRLPAIVLEVERQNKSSWWNANPLPPSPALDTWLLKTTSGAVQISGYEAYDEEDYDDERDFMGHFYRVRVQFEGVNEVISVRCGRTDMYGDREYDLAGQHDQIESLLLDECEENAAQLSTEIAYLVLAAAEILKLTPTPVRQPALML